MIVNKHIVIEYSLRLGTYKRLIYKFYEENNEFSVNINQFFKYFVSLLNLYINVE